MLHLVREASGLRLIQAFGTPNQPARSERRASLAGHETVLAALATIARRERTTVMDLFREGARQGVRSRSADPAMATAVRKSIWACAPRVPARFKSPAHVAGFKRAQANSAPWCRR